MLILSSKLQLTDLKNIITLLLTQRNTIQQRITAKYDFQSESDKQIFIKSKRTKYSAEKNFTPHTAEMLSHRIVERKYC